MDLDFTIWRVTMDPHRIIYSTILLMTAYASVETAVEGLRKGAFDGALLEWSGLDGDDLAPLFPMALIAQEVATERDIEIPGPVRDVYKQWRPTPLFRARRLEQALQTETTAHWVKVLAEADVPSGPIYSIAEACADPQTVARDLIAWGRTAIALSAEHRLRARLVAEAWAEDPALCQDAA